MLLLLSLELLLLLLLLLLLFICIERAIEIDGWLEERCHLIGGEKKPIGKKEIYSNLKLNIK
jgi:hypothetical protein